MVIFPVALLATFSSPVAGYGFVMFRVFSIRSPWILARLSVNTFCLSAGAAAEMNKLPVKFQFTLSIVTTILALGKTIAARAMAPRTAAITAAVKNLPFRFPPKLGRRKRGKENLLFAR